MGPYLGPCRPCHQKNSACALTELQPPTAEDIFKRFTENPRLRREVCWSRYLHVRFPCKLHGIKNLNGRCVHSSTSNATCWQALILRALMRAQKKAYITAHPNCSLSSILPSCGQEYSVALSRDRNPDPSMVPQATRFRFRPFFPSITGSSERRREGPRIGPRVVHCHSRVGRNFSGMTATVGHRAPQTVIMMMQSTPTIASQARRYA